MWITQQNVDKLLITMWITFVHKNATFSCYVLVDPLKSMHKTGLSTFPHTLLLLLFNLFKN